MQQVNKFITLLILLPGLSFAKGLICIGNVQFAYTDKKWAKKNNQLIRKNSVTTQHLIISNTDPKNPAIRPISESDVQEGLGEKGVWYLGGVAGTSGPATLAMKNGFSIYETTDTCGITYKNGPSGTGLCYVARIIGKTSDIEINAGSVSFEEINKAVDSYKTRSIKEFRKIAYSATIGCQQTHSR
ncbi:hypothetical protein [Aquitalea magnusonii]|uniref:hypothetical protein n=1 Tax=Aquitalea magnusonii TaxID=332411 RepID=UPI0011AE7167|nr:hypothetical protein [Aquitalea magnusonii]